MKLFFSHKKCTLIIVNLFLFLLLLFVLEIILSSFFPTNIATIGHINSKNAINYGWGYNPYERITTYDPDTGQTFIESVNNHGWRDKNRNLNNKTNSLRILILGDSYTFGAIVPRYKE